MKKLIILIVMLLSVAASSFAVEVEIDGLWYELVSKAKEAKVIQYKNNVKYSGNIVIPETVAYEGADYNVTSIGASAFDGCSGLTSVTIPQSVTSIGDRAFRGCSGLTSITIPSSVTSIGDYAFDQCSGLTSVTIPNSVTSIGKWAFYDCSGLTSVHISDIAAWCKTAFSDYYSNPLSYAHHLYLEEEEITDLVIPNSVTSIGTCAFSDCSSLTSVTIPNSVTSIGDQAFYECSGLTSITIPNSVTSIGSYAFWNCTALTSVTIPNSVTSIGTSAFYGCSALTSVTIGNSVTSIGNWAFYECSGLTSVTIGNSVTSIGSRAFYNCSGLASVTIPNSVTSIGSDAFERCSGLTSVTIPNSVTSIGNSAFEGCSGLTSVTIGSGVNKIGSQAFAKCTELADVYCLAENVPSTQSNAFEDSYIEYSTLHVPAESISAYKEKEPWSGFKEIVALDGETPEEKKCATPTIALVDGKIKFACETEGAEFVSEVTFVDNKKNYTDEVSLTGNYKVSVYATKTGYDNSDVATAEFSLSGGGTKGDVNGDGVVDIADAVKIVNIVVGKE